jgi:hypothetical protein
VAVTRVENLEIKDIEPGLLRQRRNLMVISFGIIIFELAGGTLNSVPLGYGNVILNKPEIALYFIWLALPYSLWRYWLYREPAVHHFNLEIEGRLSSLPKFLILTEKVSKDHTQGTSDTLGCKRPLIKRKLFKRSFDYSISLPSYEKTGPNSRSGNRQIFNSAPTLKAPFFQVKALELHAGLLCALTGRAITDYYLPYAVAFCAAGIIVLNHLL